MSNDQNQHKAVLSKEGASFEDPDLVKKVSGVNISNSLIGGLQQCPAKAALSKWILKDLIPDDPLSPMFLGTAFHKVMEIFYTYDPEDRTLNGIRRAYDEMTALDDFKIVHENNDAAHWVQNVINGYWKLKMEDPRSVKIAKITQEHDGKYGKYKKTEKGLELFIDSMIGKASHKTLGFIDRLSVDQRTGKYVIDDWKTGKHATDYRPDKQKYPDFGYDRQQILYAMMLEQSGYPVESARLIYPVAEYENPDTGEKSVGHINVIDIRDEKLRKQAVQDVEDADRTITQSVKNNLWECSPSPLCSWCPLVNVCPAALKIHKDNAVKARAAAPTGEFLKTGGISRA
jgi:putative RecB family exonuclease